MPRTDKKSEYNRTAYQRDKEKRLKLDGEDAVCLRCNEKFRRIKATTKPRKFCEDCLAVMTVSERHYIYQKAFQHTWKSYGQKKDPAKERQYAAKRRVRLREQRLQDFGETAECLHCKGEFIRNTKVKNLKRFCEDCAASVSRKEREQDRNRWERAKLAKTNGKQYKPREIKPAAAKAPAPAAPQIHLNQCRYKNCTHKGLWVEKGWCARPMATL